MARPFAPTPSVDDIYRAVRDAVTDAALKVARHDAADARARHMRQQLEAAAEHGAALLSALDLPRLVTTDFEPVDRAAIGEAVDSAIAALDELDGDPDLEDGDDDEGSLGWEKPGSQILVAVGCARGDDRELDTADDEDELDDDGLSGGEGDDADDESMLGAPAGDGDQEHWAQGPSHANDPEADDVDLEDDDPSGGQQRDEDLPFWSLDVGCMIGVGVHG